MIPQKVAASIWAFLLPGLHGAWRKKTNALKRQRGMPKGPVVAEKCARHSSGTPQKKARGQHSIAIRIKQSALAFWREFSLQQLHGQHSVRKAVQ
jgi:hypothetical protein